MPSYDLAPLPSRVSKLDWRYTGRLRKRDNLLTGEEGEGAESYDGEKAWSSVIHQYSQIFLLWVLCLLTEEGKLPLEVEPQSTVHIYLEYHSVCPLVWIGTPPPPSLSRKRVCLYPGIKEWGTLPAGEVLGGVLIPTRKIQNSLPREHDNTLTRRPHGTDLYYSVLRRNLYVYSINSDPYSSVYDHRSTPVKTTFTVWCLHRYLVHGMNWDRSNILF